MTTAVSSTALATIQPAFTDPERLALAGFLAGYRGLTREAYALDLRQFTTWCRARSLNLFAVRRADIESFARELEARGRARATVTRRLSTIAGFYKYAVEEELLEHSPAAHAIVHRREIADEREAAEAGMHGSPTLLVNGTDPFTAPGQPPSLSCRLYRDVEGRPGPAPSVEALRRALAAASDD
jgi:Phage integrase, N-terminal SAM-like domain